MTFFHESTAGNAEGFLGRLPPHPAAVDLIHGLLEGVGMQDLVAIVVSLAAAAWLARSLAKRFFAPPCRPPDVPGGGDGFVPLDSLTKGLIKPKR